MGERELIEQARVTAYRIAGFDGPEPMSADAVSDLLAKLADRLEALASRPAVAEGWVLVPKVPTPAMMEAWRQCTIRNSRAADPTNPFESPWTAMLSAAPKP